jgi:hypothetical protein
MRKIEFRPDHLVSGVPREREQVVMIQPKLADDDETDQPAQEFRQKIGKLMAKLAGAVALVQNRTFSSSTSSVTKIANTPSLNASIRLSPSSPCPKRLKKFIYSRSSA